METQLIRWSGMTEIKLSKKVQQYVDKCIESRECLIEGCTEEGTRRGLCNKHYIQYRKSAAALKKMARIEFERQAIKSGRILPAGAVARIRRENVFSDLAE